MLHSYWLENGCLIFLNIFLYVCLHLLNAKRKPQVSRLSSKNFLKLESGSWRYEIFFSQCFQNLDSLKESFKFTHEFFFFNAYLIFSPPSRDDSANVLEVKNSGTVGMQHHHRKLSKSTHLHIHKLLFSIWLHNLQHKNMIFFYFKGFMHYLMLLKVLNST